MLNLAEILMPMWQQSIQPTVLLLEAMLMMVVLAWHKQNSVIRIAIIT